MLHTRFVLSSELPTEITLLEVDSLLPVIRGNESGKHDDLRSDDFLGDGIVRVHDSEAQVPGVGVMRDVSGGPVGVECKFSILEEWM